MSLMVQTACAGKCTIHAILASKTLAAIHHPWYLRGGGIKILQDQKYVHLEYTNIPNVLHILQHKGHCCTNHGCALVILALSSELICCTLDHSCTSAIRAFYPPFGHSCTNAIRSKCCTRMFLTLLPLLIVVEQCFNNGNQGFPLLSNNSPGHGCLALYKKCDRQTAMDGLRQYIE
jgi:hypothetical protein